MNNTWGGVFFYGNLSLSYRWTYDSHQGCVCTVKLYLLNFDAFDVVLQIFTVSFVSLYFGSDGKGIFDLENVLQ